MLTDEMTEYIEFDLKIILGRGAESVLGAGLAMG